ncbi:MAG: hypothetical protein HZB26_06905 [Candidatus Hydrogenedentes bacterium]|nr:hypothetical protein [Candidatus Hydrogenedentota bacterium]
MKAFTSTGLYQSANCLTIPAIMPLVRIARIVVALAALSLGRAAVAAEAAYTPLCVEINADHPLFIFACPEPDSGDAEAYAGATVAAWAGLPEDLRPLSALQLSVKGADPSARRDKLRAVLTKLQAADVAVVIRIADADPRQIYPLEQIKELLREFTCIKGLQATGLNFNEYYAFGADDPAGEPPPARWLGGAIELAAQYGRFIAVQLDDLNWPRLMSDPRCRPLYDKMRTCANYVIPVAEAGGQHAIPGISSTLGLWLEGAAAQWGVAANSRWYASAHFTKPGEFGGSDTAPSMPPAFYRALVFNGVMTGATAYTFDSPGDLWYAAVHTSWDNTLYPLLAELAQKRYISRKELLVKDQIHVAYQLALSRTPQDFHLNLRDIDAVFDAGFLIHAAYGVERRGQVPEVIPNNGRYFWIPVLSPHAPQETLALFGKVVQPGSMASSQAWKELLDRFYDPKASGTASVNTGKGLRGIFVMQSHENLFEEQKYHVDAAPAAVRNIEAKWEGAAVALSWPFREGDVAYNVYRRVAPETRFTVVKHDLDQRQWPDTAVSATDTVTYTVTALTTEKEPMEGTVNFGDYLVFSAVESRVAEEVTVGPLSQAAKSQPVTPPADTRPKNQEWWPNYAGVDEKYKQAAAAVVARIEAWDKAFSSKDLDAVLDLYSTDYEDPQGWRFQYVVRAYKWFFERYGACRMERQIRQWNFKNFESSGQVEVLLYCRFTGVATTDSSGRFADVEAYFPRTVGGEVWVSFSDPLQVCRIVRTNPALPNFNDILSFSAGPFDGFQLGPDQRKGKQ